VSDDDAPGVPETAERARRVSTYLTVGAVLCGIGAFVASVLASQLLGAPPDPTNVISAAVIACLVVFIVLLAGSIVLGYAAARRRPPTD
jgi:cation transporter-like permease